MALNRTAVFVGGCSVASGGGGHRRRAGRHLRCGGSAGSSGRQVTDRRCGRGAVRSIGCWRRSDNTPRNASKQSVRPRWSAAGTRHITPPSPRPRRTNCADVTTWSGPAGSRPSRTTARCARLVRSRSATPMGNCDRLSRHAWRPGAAPRVRCCPLRVGNSGLNGSPSRSRVQTRSTAAVGLVRGGALAGHPADHPVTLTGLLDRVKHHPRRPLLQLRRVPPAASETDPCGSLT